MSEAYTILESPLRDHYVGKNKNRKIGRNRILSNQEDKALYKYILDIVEVGLSLTPIQMQKVAKMQLPISQEACLEGLA